MVYFSHVHFIRFLKLDLKCAENHESILKSKTTCSCPCTLFCAGHVENFIKYKQNL